MLLDLGGIAKGYAADEALALLKQMGIRSALVAGGGDIAVGDPPPGDAEQHLEIGGKRYSHIVNPKTGQALTGRSSVTVVAPNCTASDSLATAVSILGPKRGLELIDATPGTSALFVVQTNQGIRTFESKSFPSGTLHESGVSLTRPCARVGTARRKPD
jgi:thiamine biosynthesis lipoprotein